MKKVISIILCALLIMSIVPVVSFASSPILKFDDNGEFKIMLFADSQDNEDLEETTLAFMCDALDVYKPDLVVFLGDNTVASGYENQAKAIEAIVTPCVDRDVPFAIVFGNHDQEQGVDKEDLLDIYRSYGCLTYDANPALSGCGTCNLPIFASNGIKIAFNLWLTDSGSMNEDKTIGGYDYVHADQVEWYKNTAAALKLLNGGNVVPSINFQHIIVPEIYEAIFPETSLKGSRTVKGKNYYLLPDFSKFTGHLLEPPCSPFVTEGQFDAWVETGDVLATFSGHDHTSDFTVPFKGVDIVNVPTHGCSSYYKEYTRGAGLITLNENDLSTYDYETIKFYDLALRDGNTIIGKEGAKSPVFYTIIKMFRSVMDTLRSLFLIGKM